MQTELRAAETLLEIGVPLPVRAPFFIKWLWTPRLHQPSAGNKIRISRLNLKMGITDEQLNNTAMLEAEKLLVKHTYTHCRIIAITMFKGFLLPWLLNKPVGLWLKWKLSHKQILSFSEMVILFSGTSAFMSTTRCIREMRITAPNLGQITQKS